MPSITPSQTPKLLLYNNINTKPLMGDATQAECLEVQKYKHHHCYYPFFLAMIRGNSRGDHIGYKFCWIFWDKTENL